MIRIGIYLGIGALCHLIAIGDQFDFQSAFTYMWLLAWPLFLLFYFTVAALFLVAMAFAVIALHTAWRAI